MPICYACLEKELRHYDDLYGDEYKAWRRVCQAWDIYYNEDLHKTAKGGRGIDCLIGAYYSQMNLYKEKDTGIPAANKTYDDTILEEASTRIESIDEVKENKELKISSKTVKFWGIGYEPEEYKWLDDEYSSWVIRANNGENPSKSLEITLKEMCTTQIDIKRARNSGAKATDIARLQEIYLKLMEGAGLKPNQEDTSSIAEKNALGVLIDVWENTEPVPTYPEENKLKRYIDIWFKGHLAKAAGLNNDTRDNYNAEIEKYKAKIIEQSSQDGDDCG